MGAALRKGLEFFLGNGTAFIIKNWPTELIETPTEAQIRVDHKNALTQNARIRISNLRINAKYFNDLPAPLRVLQSAQPLIREVLIEKKGEAVTVVVDTLRLLFAPKTPDARFYFEDEGPWIPKDVIIFFQDFVDSLSLANDAAAGNPSQGPQQQEAEEGHGQAQGTAAAAADDDAAATRHSQGTASASGEGLFFKPSPNWKHSQVFQRVWALVHEMLATFHDISQMIKSTTVSIKNVSVGVREGGTSAMPARDSENAAVAGAAAAANAAAAGGGTGTQEAKPAGMETFLNVSWHDLELVLRTGAQDSKSDKKNSGSKGSGGKKNIALRTSSSLRSLLSRKKSQSARDLRRSNAVDFYRDALTAVYMEYAPAKVIDVPHLLEKFRGREVDMMKHVRAKYAVSAQHQEELIQRHRARLAAEEERQSYSAADISGHGGSSEFDATSMSPSSSASSTSNGMGLSYHLNAFRLSRDTWEQAQLRKLCSGGNGCSFVHREELVSVPSVVATSSAPVEKKGQSEPTESGSAVKSSNEFSTPQRARSQSHGGLMHQTPATPHLSNSFSPLLTPSPSMACVNAREHPVPPARVDLQQASRRETVSSSAATASKSKKRKKEGKLARSVVEFLASLSDVRVEVPLVICGVSSRMFPALAGTVDQLAGFYGACRALHLRKLFAEATATGNAKNPRARRWWKYAGDALQERLMSRRRRRLRPVVAHILKLGGPARREVVHTMANFLLAYGRLKQRRYTRRGNAKGKVLEGYLLNPDDAKVVGLVLDTRMLFRLLAAIGIYSYAYDIINRVRAAKSADRANEKRSSNKKASKPIRAKQLKSAAKMQAKAAKSYLERAHQRMAWTEIRFFRKIAMQNFFVLGGGSAAALTGKHSNWRKDSTQPSRDLQKQIQELSLRPPSSFSLSVSVGTVQINMWRQQPRRDTSSMLEMSVYATALIVGVVVAYRGTSEDQSFSFQIAQLDIHGSNKILLDNSSDEQDLGQGKGSRSLASPIQRVIFTSSRPTMSTFLTHPAFGPQWNATDGIGVPPSSTPRAGTQHQRPVFFSFAIQSPLSVLSATASTSNQVTIEISLAPYLSILDLRDVVFLRSLFASVGGGTEQSQHNDKKSRAKDAAVSAARTRAGSSAFEAAPPSWLSAGNNWRTWVNEQSSDSMNRDVEATKGVSSGVSKIPVEQAETERREWTSAVAEMYDLFARSFSGHFSSGLDTGNHDGRGSGDAAHAINILSVLDRYSSAGGLGKLVLNLNPQMPLSAAATVSGDIPRLNVGIEAHLNAGIILIPTYDSGAVDFGNSRTGGRATSSDATVVRYPCVAVSTGKFDSAASVGVNSESSQLLFAWSSASILLLRDPTEAFDRAKPPIMPQRLENFNVIADNVGAAIQISLNSGHAWAKQHPELPLSLPSLGVKLTLAPICIHGTLPVWTAAVSIFQSVLAYERVVEEASSTQKPFEKGPARRPSDSESTVGKEDFGQDQGDQPAGSATATASGQHPLQRGIRLPSVIAAAATAAGHDEKANASTDPKTIAAQRAHMTAKRQQAQQLAMGATQLQEPVLALLQRYNLCDIEFACELISITLSSEQRRRSDKQYMHIAQPCMGHERSVEASSTVVELSLRDFGLQSKTRAFDSEVKVGIGSCKVSFSSESVDEHESTFLAGTAGDGSVDSKTSERSNHKHVQASLSSEIRIGVESVSMLSPRYAAGDNCDVDFRVQLELCGQSVKLSLHPIMIESVAQVLLASKSQVEDAVRNVVFGDDGMFPVPHDPGDRSKNDLLSADSAMESSDSENSSEDDDSASAGGASVSSVTSTVSSESPDPSARNYILFLLERARAGVKSYCRWSGGQSMRVGFSLRECEIDLPHVTATLPSELASGQWISVTLTTSADLQCTIYPMSLTSSIAAELYDSELKVCLLSTGHGGEVGRSSSAALDKDVFQFEVKCKRMGLGCLIPLQVLRQNHRCDQRSEPLAHSKATEGATRQEVTASAPSNVACAREDAPEFQTVYLSDMQRFMIDLQLHGISASITMEAAKSLLAIESVQVTTMVTLNISQHATAALDGKGEMMSRIHEDLDSGGIYEDNTGVDNRHHDVTATAATVAMKIATKIGVQEVNVDVAVCNISVVHNEIVGTSTRCFPELFRMQRFGVTIALAQGSGATLSPKAPRAHFQAQNTGAMPADMPMSSRDDTTHGNKLNDSRSKFSGRCRIICSPVDVMIPFDGLQVIIAQIGEAAHFCNMTLFAITALVRSVETAMGPTSVPETKHTPRSSTLNSSPRQGSGTEHDKVRKQPAPGGGGSNLQPQPHQSAQKRSRRSKAKSRRLLTYDVGLNIDIGPVAVTIKQAIASDTSLIVLVTDTSSNVRLRVRSEAQAMALSGKLTFCVAAELCARHMQSHEQVLCAVPFFINVDLSLRPGRLPSAATSPRGKVKGAGPPRLPPKRRSWSTSSTSTIGTKRSVHRKGGSSAAIQKTAKTSPVKVSRLYHTAKKYFRPSEACSEIKACPSPDPLRLVLVCHVGKLVATAGLQTLGHLQKIFNAQHPIETARSSLSGAHVSNTSASPKDASRAGRNCASTASALSPLGALQSRLYHNESHDAGPLGGQPDVDARISPAVNDAPLFEAKNFCHRSFDLLVESFTRDRNVSDISFQADRSIDEVLRECSASGNESWVRIPSVHTSPVAAASTGVEGTGQSSATHPIVLPMPLFVEHKRTFSGNNSGGDDCIGFRTSGNQLTIGVVNLRLSPRTQGQTTAVDDQLEPAVSIPFSEFVEMQRNGEQSLPFYRAAVAWSRLSPDGDRDREVSKATRTKQVLIDIFPNKRRVHIHSCVCIRNFLSAPRQFQLREELDQGSGSLGTEQHGGHVWIVKPGRTWEMPTNFLRDELHRLRLKFTLAISGVMDDWKSVDLLGVLRNGTLWGNDIDEGQRTNKSSTRLRTMDDRHWLSCQFNKNSPWQATRRHRPMSCLLQSALDAHAVAGDQALVSTPDSVGISKHILSFLPAFELVNHLPFAVTYHLLRDFASESPSRPGENTTGVSKSKRTESSSVVASEVVAQGDIGAFQAGQIEGGIVPIAIDSNGAVHAARDVDGLDQEHEHTGDGRNIPTVSQSDAVRWRLHVMIKSRNLARSRFASRSCETSPSNPRHTGTADGSATRSRDKHTGHHSNESQKPDDVATIFLGDIVQEKWAHSADHSLEVLHPRLSQGERFATQVAARFFPVLKHTFLAVTFNNAAGDGMGKKMTDTSRLGFSGRIPAVVLSSPGSIFDITLLPTLQVRGLTLADAPPSSNKKTNAKNPASNGDADASGPLESRMLLLEAMVSNAAGETKRLLRTRLVVDPATASCPPVWRQPNEQVGKGSATSASSQVPTPSGPITLGVVHLFSNACREVRLDLCVPDFGGRDSLTESQHERTDTEGGGLARVDVIDTHQLMHLANMGHPTWAPVKAVDPRTRCTHYLSASTMNIDVFSSQYLLLQPRCVLQFWELASLSPLSQPLETNLPRKQDPEQQKNHSAKMPRPKFEAQWCWCDFDVVPGTRHGLKAQPKVNTTVLDFEDAEANPAGFVARAGGAYVFSCQAPETSANGSPSSSDSAEFASVSQSPDRSCRLASKSGRFHVSDTTTAPGTAAGLDALSAGVDFFSRNVIDRVTGLFTPGNADKNADAKSSHGSASSHRATSNSLQSEQPPMPPASATTSEQHQRLWIRMRQFPGYITAETEARKVVETHFWGPWLAPASQHGCLIPIASVETSLARATALDDVLDGIKRERRPDELPRLDKTATEYAALTLASAPIPKEVVRYRSLAFQFNENANSGSLQISATDKTHDLAGLYFLENHLNQEWLEIYSPAPALSLGCRRKDDEVGDNSSNCHDPFYRIACSAPLTTAPFEPWVQFPRERAGSSGESASGGRVDKGSGLKRRHVGEHPAARSTAGWGSWLPTGGTKESAGDTSSTDTARDRALPNANGNTPGVIVLYIHLAACVVDDEDTDGQLWHGTDLLLQRSESQDQHAYSSENGAGQLPTPGVIRDASQLRLATSCISGSRASAPSKAPRTDTQGITDKTKPTQKKVVCAVQVPVHAKIARRFFATQGVNGTGSEASFAGGCCAPSRTVAQLPNGRWIVVTVKQGRSASSPITICIEQFDQRAASHVAEDGQSPSSIPDSATSQNQMLDSSEKSRSNTGAAALNPRFLAERQKELQRVMEKLQVHRGALAAQAVLLHSTQRQVVQFLNDVANTKPIDNPMPTPTHGAIVFNSHDWLVLHEELHPTAISQRVEVARALIFHDPATAVMYIDAHWADLVGSETTRQFSKNSHSSTSSERGKHCNSHFHHIATFLQKYRHRFNAPGYGAAVASLINVVVAQQTATRYDDDFEKQLAAIFESVLDWSQLNHTISTIARAGSECVDRRCYSASSLAMMVVNILGVTASMIELPMPLQSRNHYDTLLRVFARCCALRFRAYTAILHANGLEPCPLDLVSMDGGSFAQEVAEADKPSGDVVLPVRELQEEEDLAVSTTRSDGAQRDTAAPTSGWRWPWATSAASTRSREQTTVSDGRGKASEESSFNLASPSHFDTFLKDLGAYVVLARAPPNTPGFRLAKKNAKRLAERGGVVGKAHVPVTFLREVGDIVATDASLWSCRWLFDLAPSPTQNHHTSLQGKLTKARHSTPVSIDSLQYFLRELDVLQAKMIGQRQKLEKLAQEQNQRSIASPVVVATPTRRDELGFFPTQHWFMQGFGHLQIGVDVDCKSLSVSVFAENAALLQRRAESRTNDSRAVAGQVEATTKRTSLSSSVRNSSRDTTSEGAAALTGDTETRRDSLSSFATTHRPSWAALAHAGLQAAKSFSVGRDEETRLVNVSVLGVQCGMDCTLVNVGTPFPVRSTGVTTLNGSSESYITTDNLQRLFTRTSPSNVNVSWRVLFSVGNYKVWCPHLPANDCIVSMSQKYDEQFANVVADVSRATTKPNAGLRNNFSRDPIGDPAGVNASASLTGAGQRSPFLIVSVVGLHCFEKFLALRFDQDHHAGQPRGLLVDESAVISKLDSVACFPQQTLLVEATALEDLTRRHNKHLGAAVERYYDRCLERANEQPETTSKERQRRHKKIDRDRKKQGIAASPSAPESRAEAIAHIDLNSDKLDALLLVAGAFGHNSDSNHNKNGQPSSQPHHSSGADVFQVVAQLAAIAARHTHGTTAKSESLLRNALTSRATARDDFGVSFLGSIGGSGQIDIDEKSIADLATALLGKQTGSAVKQAHSSSSKSAAVAAAANAGLSETFISSSALHLAELQLQQSMAAEATAVDERFEADVSIDPFAAIVHAVRPIQLLESLENAGRVERLQFLRFALRLLRSTFRGKYDFQGFHGHNEVVVQNRDAANRVVQQLASKSGVLSESATTTAEAQGRRAPKSRAIAGSISFTGGGLEDLQLHPLLNVGELSASAYVLQRAPTAITAQTGALLAQYGAQQLVRIQQQSVSMVMFAGSTPAPSYDSQKVAHFRQVVIEGGASNHDFFSTGVPSVAPLYRFAFENVTKHRFLDDIRGCMSQAGHDNRWTVFFQCPVQVKTRSWRSLSSSPSLSSGFTLTPGWLTFASAGVFIVRRGADFDEFVGVGQSLAIGGVPIWMASAFSSDVPAQGDDATQETLVSAPHFLTGTLLDNLPSTSGVSEKKARVRCQIVALQNSLDSNDSGDQGDQPRAASSAAGAVAELQLFMSRRDARLLAYCCSMRVQQSSSIANLSLATMPASPESANSSSRFGILSSLDTCQVVLHLQTLARKLDEPR